MFYDAIENAHGLPFDPFKAIVAPRPIGWISSVSASGTVNLAPYSYFNAISDRPHLVMFSSSGWKDSVRNIDETGEFVCNLATYELRKQMNESSATVPPEVDEFELAGLTPAASHFVKPPRVGESPAALECKAVEIKQLADLDGRKVESYLVIGQVVGVHIDDAYIRDGRFDTVKAHNLARLGYRDFAYVEDIFEMIRPGE